MAGLSRPSSRPSARTYRSYRPDRAGERPARAYAAAPSVAGRLPRRVRWVPAAAVLLTLTMTVLTATPAGAQPDAPSEEEVEEGKEKVEERADAVDDIKEKVADARERMDERAAEAQRLVEKYYREQAELERAREKYEQAKERLAEAEQGVEKARDRMAELAAQRYRSGGGLRQLGTMLGANGPQDLVDRMNAFEMLARKRSGTLDHTRAAEIVADVRRQQADAALTKQQRSTERVAELKRKAQRAAEEQRAEVERIEELKTQLEDELDEAKSRAQRLEEQREEYLEWKEEQQAAREAAQEEARQSGEAGQEAAQDATDAISDTTGLACDEKSVSLDGYANGLVPPQALCSLPQDGHMLRADAAAAFQRLNAAYADAFGEPICVTDSYRSLSVQQRLYVEKPDLAAVPGTSNHGRGVAVDLCGGINDYGTSAHEWMRDNAPEYDWVLPSWARADGSKPEPWHWEYDA